MSFLGYVYGSMIGSSLVALGVLAYSYRTSGFRYDRVLIASMNQFAWPLFQYGVLTWGLTFADKYFFRTLSYRPWYLLYCCQLCFRDADYYTGASRRYST